MSGKLVLVTGPSGYVGAHVFQTLLEKGYTVRGTVRSEEKANQLKEDFAKYKSQIESFVIVEDIAKDGAFEDAVKGVDYILHVASPFHFNIKDNKRDMLDPAVKGTNNVLTAAKKEKQIKRVVITSSFASILDLNKGDRPGYTYNEEDWNPVTWDEACTSDNPAAVYCASKKFAELAAFKFVEEQKPSFDIATMCMPMVFGPIVHRIKKMDDLNTSVANIWSLVNGSSKEVPPTDFPVWVDVRDTAEAHVAALTNEKASNQRFLLGAGNYVNEQITAIAKKQFPDKNIPGDVSQINAESKGFKIDGSKAEKVLLGRPYITLQKCITDTVSQLYELEKKL
ncbi:hypothetical protein NQZ79_g2575 [Umbelopsis isabellina]|nr:hypothetical protein NQZ79_g2575 [Umbelopsis isabellina]